MGVATEIPIDLFGAAEGALGIDDPALLVEAGAAPTGSAIVEVISEQTARAHPLKAVEKLPPEQGAKDVDRKEEVLGRADPAWRRRGRGPPPVTMQWA
jgi:hypothetical protein